MMVTAFCTPDRPEWRWRIVAYSGDVVEESRDTFASIAAAVAKGNARMAELNVVDRSTPSRHWRSPSQARVRY